MLIPCDKVNILNTFRVMIILRQLLLLTNLHLKLLITQVLFLLHINDLPSVISSKVRLFADDCLVYREIKSRQDQNDLQKDLNLLESWRSTWGMRFNAAKCNIMRVSRKQTPIPYQYELSGQVLEEVKDAKYLGVTVSDD